MWKKMIRCVKTLKFLATSKISLVVVIRREVMTLLRSFGKRQHLRCFQINIVSPFVQVNVIDENDEPPKFGLDLYETETAENDTSLLGNTIIKVSNVKMLSNRI